MRPGQTAVRTPLLDGVVRRFESCDCRTNSVRLRQARVLPLNIGPASGGLSYLYFRFRGDFSYQRADLHRRPSFRFDCKGRLGEGSQLEVR